MAMHLAVAISGRGSNLDALLRALPPGSAAEVVLVISNRAEAGGLAIARARGIASVVLADPADPSVWLEALRDARADLLVLAGYLKLVPSEVVARWRGRIINVHPALLPEFGGPGMYGRRVHEAVIAAGVAESSIVIHLVDAEYDRGPEIARRAVPVEPGDSPEALEKRVTSLEPEFFVRTLKRISERSLALP